MRALIQELILWPLSCLATVVVLAMVLYIALGIMDPPHGRESLDWAAVRAYEDAADEAAAELFRDAADLPSEEAQRIVPAMY